MPCTALAALPDDTRIWIYAIDRALSDEEQAAIRARLRRFCEGWASHGRPVQADVDVVAGRFIVVAGLIPAEDLSGCGIDASVHALQELAATHGFHLLPALSVFFRDDAGAVRSASRGTFRKLVQRAEVTPATHVFDLSIKTLGDLRAGAFEVAAATSWHAQAFGLATPVH